MQQLCEFCKECISEILNVENVDVDLASGITKINGNNINVDAIIEAIKSSGYSVELGK